jgi:hypothetical protein
MTGRLAGAAAGCTALVLLGLLPGWANQAAAAAVTGVTVSSSGTVTINGPAVPLRVTKAGQAAKVTFKGKFGQTISEVFTGLKTSDNGCANLYLIEPGGATLDHAGTCGNANPIGIGPDNLPVSGTYTIELTLDSTATGGGTLWLSAPVNTGTIKVNGPIEPLKVTRYGQAVWRTFTGKAGQTVSAVLKELDTSDNGCANLYLIEPGGATLDHAGTCGNGNLIGIGPDTLPVSGTYSVELFIATTAKGAGQLLLTSPVSVGTVTVNGPSEPLKVTRYGQAVWRTFTGKAGQTVSEVLTGLDTSDNGCANLYLIEPGGATLDHAGTCGNGNLIGIGPDILPVSGTYSVELFIATTAKGSGQLLVSSPVSVGTIKVNGPSEPLKVTRYGQAVWRTFTAKAGQKVTAALKELDTSDNGCANLYLIEPGGATLDHAGSCGNGATITIGPDTLPTKGTYSVELIIDTTATGGGQLKVS